MASRDPSASSLTLAAGDDLFHQTTPFTASSRHEWRFLALGDTSGVGVTTDGSVYEWGGDEDALLPASSSSQPCSQASDRSSSGSSDQLSRPSLHSPPPSGLRLMSALETLRIAKVAFGSEHTLALTLSGAVFAWGRNDAGQLGREGSGGMRPKRVKIGRAVDVAAAGNFSLVLTDDGVVWGCGDNSFGQLGIGPSESRPSFQPFRVPHGLPIVAMAAGMSHVLLLDFDGSLWASGANNAGQLGLGSSALAKSSRYPRRIAQLSSVVAVVAAGNASAALDARGRVYSWGDGSFGVLGSGSTQNVSAPTLVPIDAAVTSIALGPTSFFALDGENCLWACGSPAHGQLLIPESSSASADCRESGPLTSLKRVPDSESWNVRGIALSADVTLLARSPEEPQQLVTSTLSFASAPPTFRALSWVDAAHLAEEVPCPESERVFLDVLSATFAAPSVLNMSFVTSSKKLDLELAASFFEHVHEAETADDLRVALSAHVLKSCRALVPLVADTPPYALRFLHILGLALHDSDVVAHPDAYVSAIAKYAKSITALSRPLLTKYVEVLATYPTRSFRRLLTSLLASFNHILAPHTQSTTPLRSATLHSGVHDILAMIALLWRANAARSRSPDAPAAALAPVAFTADSLLPSQNAVNLIAAHLGTFNISRRSSTRLGPGIFNVFKTPYIAPLATKLAILRAEAKTQQNMAVQNAALASALAGEVLAAPPSLHIPVRRAFMAADLVSLLVGLGDDIDSHASLPLRIQFAEEEGLDDGGLTRELFSAVSSVVFSESFGMFAVNDAGYATLDPASVAEPESFRALGRFLGLALYNGAQLGVHLPDYFYSMLLAAAKDEPSPARDFGLDDLAVLDPALAHGLQCLLDAPHDEIEAYCAAFEITIDSPSGSVTHELLPDGASILVTPENRDVYVAKYVRTVLATAVANSFDAFSAGFLATSKLKNSALLHVLAPGELGELIAGSESFDMAALRASPLVTYSGGYTAESPTVTAFWDYALGLDQARARLLIKFVTGSDVPPPGGLGAMRFVIERSGVDTDRLPSASTCFNYLLLPPYEDLAHLSTAFDLALDACPGFGLR